jgi:hypothetical protein
MQTTKFSGCHCHFGGAPRIPLHGELHKKEVELVKQNGGHLVFLRKKNNTFPKFYTVKNS